ncbi:hypothetical protein ABEB22_19555 (plasmid) [Thioclava sp. 'Guangxiensis']|uniref:hypothetical protein n=1 Tax=Thioclava sp. 'Guangxiensis' TaxID=3149044 RepID=UPI0032C41E88
MTDPLSAPLWRILRNHEGRFGLSKAHHPVPLGWEPVGPALPHEAALADLRQRWCDMRPLALQEVRP